MGRRGYVPRGLVVWLSLSLVTALLASLVGLAVPRVGSAVPLNRVSWLGGNWFLLGYNYPWHQYNYDFGPE